MSVTGLCQICESSEAEYTCGQCGRAVCSRHYDEAFGLCMDCSEEAGPGQPDGPGRDDISDDVRF